MEREHSPEESGDEELEKPDMMDQPLSGAPIIPGKN